MVKGILLFILFGGSEREYTPTERYNDSLLIYNIYHSEIEVLKSVKETEREHWYQAEATNDRLTACAKLRLKKYNKKTYEPVTVFERTGMGVAHSYPKPGTNDYPAPQAFTQTSVPKYHFTVYDKQTRFLSVKDCAIKIPYVMKLVFDKGRLLFIDKLNPVTMERIEEGIETLASRAEN